VLKDVPANSVVVGVPGRVIYRDGQKVQPEKPQEDVPDIEAQAIKSLHDKLSDLEFTVKELKNRVKQQNRQLEQLKEQVPCPELSVDGASSASHTALNALDLQSTDKSNACQDPVDVFLQGAGI